MLPILKAAEKRTVRVPQLQVLALKSGSMFTHVQACPSMFKHMSLVRVQLRPTTPHRFNNLRYERYGAAIGCVAAAAALQAYFWWVEPGPSGIGI